MDDPARAAGDTGAGWVAAAIVEAVESGSRFVAPKRVREICRRWAREGPPDVGEASAVEPLPTPTARGRTTRAPILPPRWPSQTPAGQRGLTLVRSMIWPLSSPRRSSGCHLLASQPLEAPVFVVDASSGLTTASSGHRFSKTCAASVRQGVSRLGCARPA